MSDETTDVCNDLLNMARAIYLTCDEPVARDISIRLKKAVNEIIATKAEIARLREELEGLKA